MYIPANTYGETKKVAPKEAPYLWCYKDRNGYEWIGVGVDSTQEQWFNNIIQQYSLQKLCEMYPYQPLRVDKDTALLVPVFNCEYNAKLTNCFHVLYHMRLDEWKEKQENPMKASLVEEPGIGFNVSNLVEGASTTTSNTIKPEWNDAYSHEQQVIQEPNYGINVNALVENQDDEDHKYTFNNVEGSMLPEGGLNNIKPIHPSQWDTGIHVPQVYDMSSTYNTNNKPPVSNTQQNPYSYTPNYSKTFLPQYRKSIQFPF